MIVLLTILCLLNAGFLILNYKIRNYKSAFVSAFVAGCLFGQIIYEMIVK